ncbi:MAG: PH domain-containing protein [Methanobrevibacter thaueri]|nr:PH domain-containing protein [Methanobrevibacter thaueri]
MLFNKNDSMVNDMVIYQTKPNMILGCKKAIYGVILLIIILSISPMAVQFIGKMQVYLISHLKLSLTRYTAIAFFVIIFIDVIYIIWQLIGWYSIEYTFTESKIIIKSGVISTKKNYMPYATIQDVNTSQGILARIFNVGSVSVYSAYDNNQMELKNISNPSQIEEIIFSRMSGPRNYQSPPPYIPPQSNERDPYGFDDYVGREDDYYDEFEPITPITHERGFSPRREYDYYPEDFNTRENRKHVYEYEPYSQGFNNAPRRQPQDNYYNQVRDNYSYRDDNHYQDNELESYFNESYDDHHENAQEDIDVENTNTSSDAIKRHFNKFKK